MKEDIENITFSIVIPTHNRRDLLMNLLESIKKFAIRQLKEIIIVDDSTDQDQISFDMGVKVIHVRLRERVFISKAKNIGWKLASSRLVFFIDDDNRIDRDTLYGTLKVIVENDNIGAVMPSVLYHRNRNLVWVYATPFTTNRWGHELIGRNMPRNQLLENRIYDVDALPNASLIPMAVLKKVGGFDENLKINSSGTITMRIKKLGMRAVATSETFIYHDVALPGEFGLWAEHGIRDPQRVREEIVDWFTYMRAVHDGEKYFMIRALYHSAAFLLPNILSYVVIGNRNRKSLLWNVASGLIDVMRKNSYERS
ncbi:MAG: glycosyltransferase family 2 protein [Thermoplasmata archaeon]